MSLQIPTRLANVYRLALQELQGKDESNYFLKVLSLLTKNIPQAHCSLSTSVFINSWSMYYNSAEISNINRQATFLQQI